MMPKAKQGSTEEPGIEELSMALEGACERVDELREIEPPSLYDGGEGKKLSEAAMAWGDLADEAGLIQYSAAMATNPEHGGWARNLAVLSGKMDKLKREVPASLNAAIEGASGEVADFLGKCLEATKGLADALDAFIPAVRTKRRSAAAASRPG